MVVLVGGQPVRIHEKPSAWSGRELAAAPGWKIGFSREQQQRLRDITRRQAARGIDLLDYRRADFPFGDCLEVLARAMTVVRDGLGIALVKDFPVEGMTEAEYQLLTWAIGLHLGVAVPQGKATQYIAPVRDTGTVYKSRTGRGYSSNAALDYHTDASDIVLLACQRAAKTGGETKVSSGVRAHNRMLRENPDLAALLYQDFWYSQQGEEAPGEAPAYQMSIFGEREGALYIRYVRKNITFAQGLPGVPELTPAQVAALDRLDALADDEELVHSLYLEPGDIQILNNYAVLHSRTGFEDHADPEKQRLLFRLWLAAPGFGALPRGWERYYRSTAADSSRGGIRGHHYTEACARFEQRQCADMGMTFLP